MKYTKSLSKLIEITNLRIAKNLSETDNLKYKENKLDELRNELTEEYEKKNRELHNKINSSVSKIPDYYKQRSEISYLSSQLLIVSSRISNVSDDLIEVSGMISNLNGKIVVLHRKKKKYSKLISEGF